MCRTCVHASIGRLIWSCECGTEASDESCLKNENQKPCPLIPETQVLTPPPPTLIAEPGNPTELPVACRPEELDKACCVCPIPCTVIFQMQVAECKGP